LDLAILRQKSTGTIGCFPEGNEKSAQDAEWFHPDRYSINLMPDRLSSLSTMSALFIFSEKTFFE
jgi:hypothetical protein